MKFQKRSTAFIAIVLGWLVSLILIGSLTDSSATTIPDIGKKEIVSDVDHIHKNNKSDIDKNKYFYLLDDEGKPLLSELENAFPFTHDFLFVHKEE